MRWIRGRKREDEMGALVNFEAEDCPDVIRRWFEIAAARDAAKANFFVPF